MNAPQGKRDDVPADERRRVGDTLVRPPPWIVYEDDIRRLRLYAKENALADSAVAIARLLDEGLGVRE